MTQTAKHTPGPWKVGSIGADTVIETDGAYVAYLAFDLTKKPDLETQANAALIAAAPETAAERDRLKDVLFQRDGRIEQLEHNAKVHLAAAVDMQNEISDLKKQLTQSKADFQVCHRSATIRIHEVKAINEELAGACRDALKEFEAYEAPQVIDDPTFCICEKLKAVLAKHKAEA